MEERRLRDDDTWVVEHEEAGLTLGQETGEAEGTELTEVGLRTGAGEREREKGRRETQKGLGQPVQSVWREPRQNDISLHKLYYQSSQYIQH